MRVSCWYSLHSCTVAISGATHYGRFTGRFDIVQALLDSGDDPTLGLREAICHHRTDIVRLLLAFGAKNNLDANNGDAMQVACAYGHLEMMKILLEAGADPLACKGECIRTACRDGRLFFFVHCKTAATHSGDMFRSLGFVTDPT